MRSHCNKKGEIFSSDNLTDRAKKGREQIRQGIANQGWMLYNTDKSGKLCLDTTQNYIECMSSHTKDDPIVTAEDVREDEKVLNNHVRNWVQIGRMGSV